MPFYIYIYFFMLTLFVLFLIHYDNKHRQQIEELHARDTEEWKNSNNYPQFNHDTEVFGAHNQNDKPS